MQDPVLFSGSLRSNMDPEGAWPDHKLWGALAAVQLKEAVVKVSYRLIRNSLQGYGHILLQKTHHLSMSGLDGAFEDVFDANDCIGVRHTKHHLPCRRHTCFHAKLRSTVRLISSVMATMPTA